MPNYAAAPNAFIPYEDSIVLRIERDAPIEMNITNSCPEVNIYEDINLPYLTGTIAVIDSAGIGSLQFGGTEKIILKLQNNTDAKVVTKEFVIYQVTDHKRQENGMVVSFIIHIMETHGYQNHFRHVSRVYDTNHSNMIRSICATDLDVDIGDMDISYQSSKLIVPNLRPLQACRWILDQTTTSEGKPFFFYSSLKEGLHLKSLESLYDSENVLNTSFSLRPAGVSDFNDNANQILSHVQKSNDRIIDAQHTGILDALRCTVDPFKNEVRYFDYSHREYHENKEPELGYDGLPYDKNFEIRGQAFVTTLNTSLSFGDESTAYEEETELADYRLGLNSKADKYFLDKSCSEIAINGWHMFSQDMNTSIGRVIDINIPITSPQTTEVSIDGMIDQKYSGKFLITAVRHKFSVHTNNYVCSLGLKRTSNQGEFDGTR
jgi:hypothetical protein